LIRPRQEMEHGIVGTYYYSGGCRALCQCAVASRLGSGGSVGLARRVRLRRNRPCREANHGWRSELPLCLLRLSGPLLSAPRLRPPPVLALLN
jgi:hypothetical protein